MRRQILYSGIEEGKRVHLPERTTNFTEFLNYRKTLYQEAKLIKGVSRRIGYKKSEERFARPRCEVFIVSPHPDDEVFQAMLAIRLRDEIPGLNVLNIAVTLGSDPKRKSGRLSEVSNSCDFLEFYNRILLDGNPDLDGLDCYSLAYGLAIYEIRMRLLNEPPKLIIIPHEYDRHPTHIKTHKLVMRALNLMPKTFCCGLIQTEFWGELTEPNLLVELSREHVGTLMAALLFHEGEIARNPYHLRLPDLLSNNVRRAEIVGGMGCDIPNFEYGAICRFDKWKNGMIEPVLEREKFIGLKDSLEKILFQ